MFDIGWTELLVIGIVALIVVGPKDLPGMFRTLGRFTAKARNMAREFTRAMEDAADEVGVKEMTKTLKDVASPKNMGLDKIKDAATKFESWDPTKPDTKTRGPATAEMTEERAATAKKFQETAAKKATDRLAAEAKTVAKPEKTASKKAEGKKSSVKKPAAKKPAAKKPAAKKTAAKTSTQKASAKKPAAKNTAVKNASAKKTDK